MRALFALCIRSVREDTRARLPVILRTALVLIILLTVWANQRDFERSGAPGREFLLVVVFTNLAFVAVAALSIFSSAITEEKEDETLPLLRMTGLSPLAILFGKGATQFLGALFLLAVQIPFSILAVTLGGVSIGQVLSAYAILGATTFFLCNLALLGSVICRTTVRAGVFTGLIGGVLFFFLPFICSVTALQHMNFLSLTPRTAWEHFSAVVVKANPVFASFMVLEHMGRYGGGYEFGKSVWPNLGAGLLCFILSWALFNRFCSSASEAVGNRTRGVLAFLFRKKGGRHRPSFRRALAWKDFHFLIGGSRGILIRFTLCGLAFFACYAVQRWGVGDFSGGGNNGWFWRQVGEMTLGLSLTGCALELSMLAAGTFGSERRGRTLAGLVSLPRPTGWLIRQKLLGCLPALVPTTFLFGVGLALVINYNSDDFNWDAVIASWERTDELATPPLYGLSQTLLLPLVIMWLSLRIRRGAMPAGITIVALLNVLTAALMDAFSDDEFVLFAIACLCLAAAPVLAILIYRGIPRAASTD